MNYQAGETVETPYGIGTVIGEVEVKGARYTWHMNAGTTYKYIQVEVPQYGAVNLSEHEIQRPAPKGRKLSEYL